MCICEKVKQGSKIRLGKEQIMKFGLKNLNHKEYFSVFGHNLEIEIMGRVKMRDKNLVRS